MKILFILKDRFYNKSHSKSYGLINSSKQVAQYLEKIGHEYKIVQVIDGNSLDKEIFEYKPDMVIIEALWVTGSKIKELMEIPRYKNIQWVIRVHSDIGFLSAETLAMKYINDYINLKKDNLFVSCNNLEFNYFLSKTINYDFVYLPNIIELEFTDSELEKKEHIDIGSFGSLRILKNQCYQAMCAIAAADKLGKKLKFHVSVDINIDKNENTNPVLKNLEELFSTSEHELIKHSWLANDDFHELIKTMDLGLQLSYTESFNIVTADFVRHGVPIIVSDAIKWMPNFLKTSTVDYHETIHKIIKVYRLRNCKFLTKWSRRKLKKYNNLAKSDWLYFMNYFENKKS